MKTRALIVALAAAVGVLAGAGACAPNRASIQVQAICYPTDDCKFQGKCDTYFGGLAGVTSPGWLTLFLEVENQLPNNGNFEKGLVNTNDAHVTEIRAEFEGGQSNTSVMGANTSVPASTSKVVPVYLPITGDGEILARVRLSGYYDNGSSFETGSFPISIVAGAGACAGDPCAGATSTCPAGGAGQCPVACGSGSGGSGGGGNTYTLGGSITGLTGTGLLLSTPGYADLSVAGGATNFVFTGVADGATYDVTISRQPTGQNCFVTGGTGTVGGGNVTTVRITCA